MLFLKRPNRGDQWLIEKAVASIMQSKIFLALLPVFLVGACESTHVDLSDTGEPLLLIGRTVGGEFIAYEDLDDVGISIAPSSRNSALDIRVVVASPGGNIGSLALTS